MPALPCHRTACTRAAHPACWNAMTGGAYCLLCAREIAAHEEPGVKPLFPFLALFTSDMARRLDYIEAKAALAAQETGKLDVHHALEEIHTIAKDLRTIYPTRAKVDKRGSDLVFALGRLQKALRSLGVLL